MNFFDQMATILIKINFLNYTLVSWNYFERGTDISFKKNEVLTVTTFAGVYYLRDYLPPVNLSINFLIIQTRY